MLDELDVVKFSYRDEVENPRLKLANSSREFKRKEVVRPRDNKL